MRRWILSLLGYVPNPNIAPSDAAAVHATVIAHARLCKCACMRPEHAKRPNGNHAEDGPVRLHDAQGRRHSPNDSMICCDCVNAAKLGYSYQRES